MKRLSIALFSAAIAYYLFHFLFFWVFESTDSFFYFALAQLIKTGKYFVPLPYNYNAPSTMEPPLYSLFLYIAQVFPRADIIVHLVQILAIVISSVLIYKIFEKYTKIPSTTLRVNALALLITTSFLVTPSHTIYISNLVAEPIAVLFITSYIYLVHLILNKKRQDLTGPLLVLSAVATLQRYNLIVFWGMAVLLFFWQAGFQITSSGINFSTPPKRSRNSWILSIYSKSLGSGVVCKIYSFLVNREVFFLFLSAGILVGWILINHSLNGSWGLSNATGKHLYNRIFHFDRILPPADDPSFVKFKSMVGGNIDYFKPWWFYEPALLVNLGYDETKSSQVLQDVFVSALKTNPAKYILDTPRFFLFAHGQNPTYDDPLYLYSGKMKDNCRTLGNIEFCKPIISSKFAFTIWDKIVRGIDFYYLHISRFINYLLLFPAIIIAVFRKNSFMRFAAVLYLASILFFVLTEAAIPRYTYIFTPLKTILIGYLVIQAGKYYSMLRKA